MMTSIEAIEKLAQEWIKLYKKNPITTTIVTLILSVAFGTTMYVVDTRNEKIREKARLENLSFSEQINQLNSTEANLKELIEFIESQKTQLRQSQDLLESLNKEKKQLEPLVEADRKAVEALFEAQAERTQDNKWKERWIGCAFGVLASIVATIIWTTASILWQERIKPITTQQLSNSDDNHNS